MTKKNKIRFLFITDPWSTLDHRQDTTLRLAEEALKIGHPCFWSDFHTIRWDGEKIVADVREILEVPADRSPTSIVRGEFFTSDPSGFESIHYRPDPPINLSYLHPLQFLAGAVRSNKSAQIVNPPEVLTLSGEKLEPLFLKGLAPPSVASSLWDSMKNFGTQYPKTVLKPLNEAQSKGIQLLLWNSPSEIERSKGLLSSATLGFKRPVLLQRFQEEISDGEFRIWFLDGKVLAFVKKLPVPGDFRVNMDRGSQVKKVALGPKEKKALPAISKRLKALGVRLAAVDIIGGYVTDFNFTSPGMIPVMEEVLGENLAKPIIKRFVI